MKIGITEQGDAGLDFTWVNKLSYVDCAIIISKSMNKMLFKHLKDNQEKCIFHATITSLGGTRWEPNVKFYKESLKNLEYFISVMNFPSEQIVLRFDPIISYNQTHILETEFIPFLQNYNIKRLRFSLVTWYPHVLERLNNRTREIIKNKSEDDKKFILDKMEKLAYKYPTISFESCALKEDCNFIKKQGCISEKDLEILNIKKDFLTGKQSFQRKECLCLAEKTELLKNKKQCPHGCLYCYWK